MPRAWRAPERQHKRTPATPARKLASSGAQPKCLYANACRIGNKQEELETCVCLQGYGCIGITETWWDGFYNWSVGMEGYRSFRKDRQGLSPSMSMISWSAWSSASGWMQT